MSATTRITGFTLVEAMLVLLLFSLLLGSVFVTLQLGQRSWANYSENVLVKQALRRSLIAMVTELREADNIFITRDEHSVILNFERPELGMISYVWSDLGDDAHKIIRKNYTLRRLLANNISFLSFTYPVNNEIIIEVAAGKTQTYGLREVIALRCKTSLIMQGRNENIQ